MKTPLLFIIYNRPQTTEQVFRAIRAARPPALFVAADGPMPAQEADRELCAAARAIATSVDWACDLKTLLSDEHLGCRRGVVRAITWFFQNVEEGIILEDDCLPLPDFFSFCEEILDRYRDNVRVMDVTGSNFHFGRTRNAAHSYHFSVYGSVWGWATWKRAWVHYDGALREYLRLKEKGGLQHIWASPNEGAFLEEKIEQISSGQLDTWDYQWNMAKLIRGGLSVVPNVNLVSNIGYGAGATHTKRRRRFACMPTEHLPLPLRHPPFVVSDRELDERFVRMVMGSRVGRTFKQAVKRLLRLS